jgi:hypothetical protein
LKGLARWTYRQKNDGLESFLVSVELPTGKIVRTSKSWYTSDSDTTRLVRQGERTFLFNRMNLCARLDERGEATMFETSQIVNHALGASADGKVLLTGGLGEGSHGPIDGARTTFRLEPLPGQAEYFTHFLVLNDGSAWGVTTAYRLVRISKDGRIEQTVAVY